MTQAVTPIRKQVAALKTIPYSEVKIQPVTWLWLGRVPYSKVTILDGDPGLGKSTLALTIAAAVTRSGPLPGCGPAAPGNVLVLSSEDGPGDTILPRLKAAGADLTKVFGPMEFSVQELPRDTEAIQATIVALGITLVIVDPVMDFLGGKLDAHRDQDVRQVTRPLAAVANGTGAAILLVRHLNKAAGKSSIYRGGGSIGFSGAARSVLVCGYEPGSADVRVIAPVKANLSRLAKPLRYTIEGEDGEMRIAWLGESEFSADQILAPPPTDLEDPGALATACDFLTDVLADGPMKSADVTKQAKAAGISDKTLARARAKLRCKAKKGFDKQWRIALPEPNPLLEQDEPGADG